jgi:hypothetical protein
MPCFGSASDVENTCSYKKEDKLKEELSCISNSLITNK